MRSLEELFRKNNLKDPDDIDALLELAEIVGGLGISVKRRTRDWMKRMPG